MNHQPHVSEFDKTLIKKAKERAETNFLRGVENPTQAAVLDNNLTQRGKDRSDANYINAKEARLFKQQYNATLKKNWLRNETEKKNRIIRDLQFELAKNSVIELKKKRSVIVHRDAQQKGIADFESSLFKSGLGCVDDEGGTLGISYETGEAFLERIEDLARDSFPVDDEISKFVCQLKVRTKEKKVARHEKERRKRKTAADKNNLVGREGTKDHASEEIILTGNQSDSTEDEMTMDVEAMQRDRNILAEDNIRIFAEQSRMRHENSGHHSLAIKVMQQQEQREISKRKAVNDTCRLIVLHLLSTIDYGKACRPNGADGHQRISEGATEVLNLVDLKVYESMQIPVGSSFIVSFADLSMYDSWLSYVALSANIGHWSIAHDSKHEAVGNTGMKLEELSWARQGSQNVMSKKTSLFLESTSRRLEALLTISCGGKGSNISLALNEEEQRSLYPADFSSIGVLLLLRGGNGASVCVEDMLQTIDWLGGRSNIEIWDVAAAIDFGRKIAPLLEGKIPLISYGTLLEAFISNPVDAFSVERSERHVAPSKVIALTPKALKVATEIVDVAHRIMSTIQVPVSPAPTGGKVEGKHKGHAVQTASFTDFTFGVLLGQVLWLRNFIKVLHAETSSIIVDGDPDSIKQRKSISVRSPFAPIVIASRCVHYNLPLAADDSVTFALAVDWFMRGGSREAVNESGGDSANKRVLKEALSVESDLLAVTSVRKGKDKNVPKGKGCGAESEPMGPSILGGILRIGGDKILELSFPRNSYINCEPNSQPILVDPTDLEVNAVTDPLNTPARRFISSYSQLQKQSCEAASDIISYEPVLTDLASQLCIPYLRLVCKRGVRNASSLPPTGSEAEVISFSPGLSAAEALLSFVLASSKGYCAKHIVLSPVSSLKNSILTGASPSQDGTEVGIDRSCCSVSTVISQRRMRISDAEQLWLSHISDANPIDLHSAYTAHKLCLEARIFEVELIGAVLMSYGLSVSSLEGEIRSSEAKIVNCLKTNDLRLGEICQHAQKQLIAGFPAQCHQQNRNNDEKVMSKEDRDVIVNNCVCKLGDIIDGRHLKWIHLATSEHSKLEKIFETFRNFVECLCCKLAEVTAAAHTRKAEAGRAVADLMINAHYASLPWKLPHSGSKGTRRAVDVRKDKLRSAALLLKANYRGKVEATTLPFQAEATDDDNNDPWKNIRSFDNLARRPDASGLDTSILDSIVDELYAETLESSASLLLALQLDLTAKVSQYEAHQKAVQTMIVTRFQYEHSSLTLWSSALNDSLTRSPVTDSLIDHLFHPSRYFNITDVAGMDKVPPKMGLYALELGDITLSLHSLRSLSVPMIATLGDSRELLSEDSCCKLLMGCASVMGEDSLPLAWRHGQQQRNLVCLTLGCSQSSATFRPCTRKSFVQALISVLLLAAIHAPPTIHFILRLGELFAGTQDDDGDMSQRFSFTPTRRPSLSAFSQVILHDKKLADLWQRDPNGSTDASTISMENALFAVASSCKDAEGCVVIEQVMLLLCRVPSRSSCFERSLLFHADTLSSSYLQLDAVQLPSFSSEGIFKALTIASRVTEGSPSSSDCDIDCITPNQLKWLLDNSPDKIPLVLDFLHDVEIFRPSFSMAGVPSASDISSSVVGVSSIEIDQSQSRSQYSSAVLEDSQTTPSLRLVGRSSALIVDVGALILRSLIRDGSERIPFCV